MSKAKVERRKQEKYNRKKNELKRKIKAVVVTIAMIVVVAAIGALIGYQVYSDYFKYDTIADINIADMYTALTDVQTANVADKKEASGDLAPNVTEVTTDGSSEKDEDSKDKESEDKKDEDSKDKESEDKKDEDSKDKDE